MEPSLCNGLKIEHCDRNCSDHQVSNQTQPPPKMPNKTRIYLHQIDQCSFCFTSFAWANRPANATSNSTTSHTKVWLPCWAAQFLTGRRVPCYVVDAYLSEFVKAVPAAAGVCCESRSELHYEGNNV
eukprot:6472141-Amphidinium_carterae.1